MRWEVFIEEDGVSFFHLEFAIGGKRPNDFVLGSNGFDLGIGMLRMGSASSLL